MPINLTNIEAINAYDANQQLDTTNVLALESPHDDEHAAQCVVFEMLRELMATGMTPAQYNDMSQDDYDAAVQRAVYRAALNVNAPVMSSLDNYGREAAANIGGNYFEHGYAALLNAMAPSERIRFTRLGGLVGV